MSDSDEDVAKPATTTLEKTEKPAEAPADAEHGAFAKTTSAVRYAPGAAESEPAPRFWSVRRLPAGLAAALLIVAAGVPLYDIVSVRAERPAAAWRRRLADELAATNLDDAWVVLGALAAMLLGVLLVVLAVTPGLRGLLPMRRGDDEFLRAGIERGAAAVVLRDRALEVSGVRSVRVSVGRRRVRAWAQAHFRDLDVVRADLDAVLGEGIRELGLARQPALAVQVRRPARR
ncbi:DUF6286 domain-containing protein [Streptomyces millisiae]|uniref:DUF6286 domain-containing protein n=1 Tax=Streptomyces millisiae TaxID=3075542 RepID=A0ABU2LVD5_9ACTN|nr:DUF6286 domain-containing protein [Streptomyces sp. DSM 44918]MDT0321566.1 DUF6286 domain-containing protein [Streptomyces sp. DSM 44918]